MSCPRCFHSIGEHYLCLEHGGEAGFNDAVKRWRPRSPDFPPPAALLSFKHPWWNFLDNAEYLGRITNIRQHKDLSEAIP